MKLTKTRQSIELLTKHHQLWIACIGIGISFLILELLAQNVFPPATATTAMIDLSFVPEVWLSVIGLTLGTLVIVISVAAQNIPKVAEFYMSDWISLLYIWFVIAGGSHSLFIKILQAKQASPSGAILNGLILLPLAILGAFPYIFYVLKNIQPNTVIKIIVKRHLRQIQRLPKPSLQPLLHLTSYRESYQKNLLDALSQLESIFGYVSFKEPKAQIIQNISQLLKEYIWVKSLVDDVFVTIGPTIREDIAFQTMLDQFEDLEQNRTFYEQKCFRVLGNAFIQLLEDREFDLASLCGAKMSQVGLCAIQANDDQLVELTTIRINTMLRFAMKYGSSQQEVRHLYNMVFHYRQFIEFLIEANQREQAQKCVFYLRSYGNEAYHLGRSNPPLLFIVDVVAAEIRKILIKTYEAKWPKGIQRSLLDEMLKVDNPPELDTTDTDQPHQTNSGVRTLQISLALYYLKVGEIGFVEYIIADILDDMLVLGQKTFQKIMQRTCDRIKKTAPTYWEATDRGNANLYYTPDSDQIPQFLEHLSVQIQRSLNNIQ